MTNGHDVDGPDAPWRVILLDARGDPVGAGVLISASEILTCAHVVIAALGLSRDQARRPEALVRVGFPTAAGVIEADATVHLDGWHLGSGTLPTDVAILTMTRAAPAGVLPASFARWSAGSAVRAFGHPRSMPNVGAWARATLGGTAVTGRVQLDGGPGWQIEKGFSGAGVELVAERTVCGIIVTAMSMDAPRISHMIPIESIANLWPPLQDRLHPTVRTSRPPPPPSYLVEDALRALRAFGSLQSRLGPSLLLQRIVAVLGPLRPPMREYDDPVESLLMTCLANGGAMRLLVDLLARDGRDPALVERLRGIVALIDPYPLLSDDQRGWLCELLSGATEEQLAEAARYAADGGLAVGQWHGLMGLVSQLELRACPPEEVPDLLKFVDHCAHTVPSSHTGLELHEMILDLLTRDAPRDRALRARRRLCQATGRWLQNAWFTLMISLEAADGDRYHCRMFVWRNNAREPYRRHDSSRDAPLTELEVQQRIQEVLRQESALTLGDDDVPIEFFLPRSLFDLPVDQWPLPTVPDAALGHRHVVVIRSLDRLRKPDQHPSWRRASQRVMGARLRPDMLYWHNPAASVPSSQLFAHLMANIQLSGMVVSHPAALTANSVDDPSQAALDAGLPLIIWVRQARPPAQFSSELDPLIRNQLVSDVLNAVRGIRARAGSGRSRDSLGHHLVVLWDPADVRGQALAEQLRLASPDGQVSEEQR